MICIATRVLVYDPGNLQRELLTIGLGSLGLGFTVKPANSLEAMVDILSEDADWVVLVCDCVGGNRPTAVARHLRDRFPDVPFVFMLQEGRIDRVVEAFRAGARGIVYSNESLSQLASCISRVRQGEVCVRGVDLSTITEFLQKPNMRITDVNGKTLLSPREGEVSQLVAEGMSNREVARSLQISESTVKNCLFHVFEKLGISNRVELTRYVNGALAGD